MKKHWMIVLALLVFATGCDQKQKAEDDARNAEQNAKVAEAVKKQKRGAMTMPSEGPAEKAAPKDDKGDSAEKDGSATKNGKPGEAKPDEGKSDEGKSDDGKSDDGNEDDVEKTETSAKLNAKTVLDNAIALAKTENKALFVHFTADW